jgi:nucleotidyltransferase/DNA polymerase involved in DNA repair
MNPSTADNAVQWLFLDLNAFFASCEQQENPALRGQPVIVVQTPTDSAVAIAASYAAKSFGIKTGTLVRDARRLCPDVIPVQANHRLYTDYHERILKAVDTCLPVEKVCSIDEMACRLMGTERQVPVARTLALKVKRALKEQVGEIYWWDHAAQLVSLNEVRRAGLITTKTIAQASNRPVLRARMNDRKHPVHLAFAIPNHPWYDTDTTAAVRIAMTVIAKGAGEGTLACVKKERRVGRESVFDLPQSCGEIQVDLSLGAAVATAAPLAANAKLS